MLECFPLYSTPKHLGGLPLQCSSGRLDMPGRTGGQPCEQMASLKSSGLMMVLEEGQG